MPSACFQGVYTLWIASKHAEGMSLRYGAVIFGDLTHPPLRYGVFLICRGILRVSLLRGLGG